MPSDALTSVAIAEVLPAQLRKTFAMWPLSEYGHPAFRQALCASSLADAEKICTPPPIKASLARGGFPAFVILETDETAREGSARHTLHFYTVKAKREWRRLGDNGEPIKAAVPYVERAGSLPMDAFQPRRPFRAGVDSAANGRQPDEPRMIEAGARR